jgi:hypothetical protein
MAIGPPSAQVGVSRGRRSRRTSTRRDRAALCNVSAEAIAQLGQADTVETLVNLMVTCVISKG